MIAASTTSVIIGASMVATRSVVAEVGPEALGFFRYGSGGLAIVLVLWAFSNKNRRLLAIKPIHIPALFLFATIAYTLYPICFGAALKRISASLGAILFATIPLWSAVFSLFIGHDRLRLGQWLGILLTVAGTVVATVGTGDANLSGDLFGKGLMIFAAALPALAGALTKPLLAKYRSLTIAGLKMCFGSATMLPIAFYRQGNFFAKVGNLNTNGIIAVVFIGFFGGVVDNGSWYYALSKLRPTQAFVFLNLSPVVATILGILLLGETVGVAFIIAAMLIIAGVILCQRAPKKK